MFISSAEFAPIAETFPSITAFHAFILVYKPLIAVPAALTADKNVPALASNTVEVYAIAVFLASKASTTTLFASTFVWAVAKSTFLLSARV